MASQSIMLKASGLNTNFQSLMEVPPGALLQAKNIVINRDGIIESRRGLDIYAPIYSTFYGAGISLYDPSKLYVIGDYVRYSDAIYVCKLGTTGTIPTNSTYWTYTDSDIALKAKQLFEYKSQILVHTSDNKLAYLDSGYGRYSYLPGSTSLIPPNSLIRLKSEESKGNLFITNSSGVKKISAKDSYDITNSAGPILTNVGTAKAIAPIASVQSFTATGFLVASTALLTNKVAYRALFIKTDNNSNSIFGSPSNRTIVINPSITTAANVSLRVTLPKDIYNSSESYKVRLYRSEQLLSSTAEPSDELFQVYESDVNTFNPFLDIIDSISDTGRLGGVPLYTNPNSGEGILKANEVPPSASDIAAFKGHMFYANTKTKDNIILTLADVTKINSGTNLILTDGSAEGTETYGFGFQERHRQTIAITTVTAGRANFAGRSIWLFAGNDDRKYVFWFDETAGQTRTSPLTPIPTGYIGVKVNLNVADTTLAVATALNAAIAAIPVDFTVTNNYNTGVSTINVINTVNGACSVPYWDGSNGVTFYPTSSKITVASAVVASYSGFNIQLGTRVANAQKRYAFWFDGTVGQTTPTPTNIPSGFTLVKVNVYNAVPTTATIATALSSAIAATGEFTSIYTAGTSILQVVPIGGTYNPDTVTTNSTGLLTLEATTLGRGETANLTNMQTATLTINSTSLSDYQTIDFTKYCYLEFFGPISTDTASANKKYVVWFDITGSDATPTIFNATLIKVNITGLSTTAAIAGAISTALQANTNFSFANASRIFTVHYTATTNSIQIITQGTNTGYCANTTLAVSAGIFGGLPQISVSTTYLPTISSQVGNNSTFPRISTNASTPAAIEETVRSLVQTINSNQNSKYVAQYLSNFGEVPGKFIIEKKSFDDLRFIVTTTQPSASSAFSPSIGVAYPLSSISETVGGANITTSYNLGTSFALGTSASSTFLFGVRRLANSYANFSSFPSVGDVSKLYKAIDSGFLYNWTGSAYSLASNDNSSLNGECVVSSAGEYFTNQKYFTVNKAYNEEIEYSGFAIHLNDFRKSCSYKSSSEIIPNRLYYSKYQEQEAVPLLNYIDIGSRDQQILRIVPLRESLFILKEDGVYRLAGDPGANPTWDVGAFDTTAIIKAPDTAITLGNQCYFLSNQGVMQLNESSIQSISRPIDNKLLPLITTNTNLPSLSFSVSYESDKSFLMWTVTTSKDTVANICYRYNYVTNAWTEWTLSKTCGLVSVHDDKMYLGAATDNYIEIERKGFNRFDYADRELSGYTLTSGALGDSTIANNTLFTTAKVGDACSQTQYVSFEEFNRLLNSLDYSYQTSSKDYLQVVRFSRGDDLLNNITLLMTKLQADEGFLFSSYSVLFPASDSAFLANYSINSLSALQLKYNEIIYVLRRVFDNLDYSLSTLIPAAYNNITSYVVGDLVSYSNDTYFECIANSTGNIPTNITYWKSYVPLAIQELKTLNTGFTTLSGYIPKYKLSSGYRKYEAMITALNNVTKLVEFESTPSFMIGPFTVAQSIPVEIEYAPQHIGDPASSKQFSVGTFMFEKKSFSNAQIAYNNDISDHYEEVPVVLNSYSTFGAGSWGEGTWGGSGDQSQLRTYIPLRKQRCRFLGCKFIHSGAMEFFRLYGLSLSYRVYAIADRDFK